MGWNDIKIIDCHSDMFADVTQRRMMGESHIIEGYHTEQLEQGHIQAMICCIWIDPPYTAAPTLRMMQIMGAVCRELRDADGIAEIAYTADDFEKIRQKHKLAILLGMEGLSGLQGQVDFLDVLYRFGIRHAMLTWNEENEFANGVGGSVAGQGLTPLGIRAVQRMEKLGMVVDVSHAAERTFWDIYDHTEKPFIASHSDVYALCPDVRNLKDEQIRAVAERGGVIGMNAWPEFIAKEKPDAEKLADHVDYIVQMAGIDAVVCGFDFCDYLSPDSMTFSSEGVTSTAGIANAKDAPNFLRILQARGYCEEDLEKIAYKNILRVLANVIS
ncbi:MAG: membrane dipeptidase [Megasphaera sp.]|jgi:membrane dipeptidase|nr:membrane dipeptidase [Megasphaera sp.]